MSLARPHKVLDAAELESWANAHYFDIYDEWECSDAVEWVDFWDWLTQEYWEEFEEFEDWFRREERDKRFDIGRSSN